MNIKTAKEHIQHAIRAYLVKDEYGNYVIPTERQRPMFLIGAPGIGKTDIMKQIAEEEGIGLLSYSMTHHTRQSALGLPLIEKKVYNGEEYNVSQYTMSEIISSIYDMIEKSNFKEGILFLDEINCVSETLSPVMLQFLQYKTFGNYKVPQGWVVVTAGNPPEYNKSVHEFDIVTWDRVRRLDVEADYTVWKEYAYKKGVHPAILAYLDVRKEDFYKVETTVDGHNFVTARGWSDLSDVMQIYEKKGFPIDNDLIKQYIQDKKIARNFAIYYELFIKYRSDYHVDMILAGKAPSEVKSRAKNAKFDERLCLLNMLIYNLTVDIKSFYIFENSVKELLKSLKQIKTELVKSESNGLDLVENQYKMILDIIQKGKASSSLSQDREHVFLNTMNFLDEIKHCLITSGVSDVESEFNVMKTYFDKKVKEINEDSNNKIKELDNVFTFCEEVFKDEEEILILTTELTVNYYCAYFISKFGCEKYFKHNKSLLISQRHDNIMEEIGKLDSKSL